MHALNFSKKVTIIYQILSEVGALVVHPLVSIYPQGTFHFHLVATCQLDLLGGLLAGKDWEQVYRGPSQCMKAALG